MLDGLLVVDKPAGWTSHDVVARLRRVVGQKRVGHAGTLDPDATGVLLVGLGRVTRLLQFLQTQSKAYDATVVFGVATDTLDASGTVVASEPMEVTAEQVAGAAVTFVGDIEQVPPMVSAVKIGGRRLHELAREGKEVERPPRPVTIHRLEVENVDPGPPPAATITVECSSGTYIRTLASDLGAALGGPAHLGVLRRTRVGDYTLADATPLEVVESDPAAVLLTPAQAVGHLRRVRVGSAGARHVEVGRPLTPGDWSEESSVPGATAGGGEVAVVDDTGELLAVYEPDGDTLRPTVVVASAS